MLGKNLKLFWLKRLLLGAMMYDPGFFCYAGCCTRSLIRGMERCPERDLQGDSASELVSSKEGDSSLSFASSPKRSPQQLSAQPSQQVSRIQREGDNKERLSASSERLGEEGISSSQEAYKIENNPVDSENNLLESSPFDSLTQLSDEEFEETFSSSEGEGLEWDNAGDVGTQLLPDDSDEEFESDHGGDLGIQDFDDFSLSEEEKSPFSEEVPHESEENSVGSENTLPESSALTQLSDEKFKEYYTISGVDPQEFSDGDDTTGAPFVDHSSLTPSVETTDTASPVDHTEAGPSESSSTDSLSSSSDSVAQEGGSSETSYETVAVDVSDSSLIVTEAPLS